METVGSESSSVSRRLLAWGWHLADKHVWNRVRGQIVVVVFLFSLAFLTDHAATSVLDPGSVEVQNRLPRIEIAPTSKGFRLTYPARNRTVGAVFNACPRSNLKSSRWSSSRIFSENNEVVFEAPDEAVLAHLRTELIAADVALPGSRVIHGRVTDPFGNPVANAQVDLMGRYRMINHYKTRSDGTFTIIVSQPKPPARMNCHLRFRLPKSGGRFVSGRFVLDEVKPVAYVDVSRTVFEQYRLLYVLAAAALAVFVVHDVKRLIRHRRRRPGTCMTSGYDLRGAVSERCSECGTVISDEVRGELARRCADDQVDVRG